MKKILSVLLITCLLFTLFACHPTEPEKLSTPTNVQISESGLVTWDAVPKATGYSVTIDGQTYTTAETQYQAPNVNKSFTCNVIATAEGLTDSDAATATFTYKPPVIVVPPETVGVAIVGSSEVRSGQNITLRAKIDGKNSSDVTWSVIQGDEYVDIDYKGVVTAVAVNEDHIVKIKATSTVNTDCSAEKVLTVVAKTTLTQAMLDVFNGKNKVSFEGYLGINLYSPGVTGDVLQGTYMNTIQTAMDGENWYAMYDSTGAGVTQGMYVKNKDNLAQQVSVSLMNDEEYYPMKDNSGLTVSWEDSGLYNSMQGLKVSDFKFDEETWRWTYNGKDDSFVRRVVASANPYEFTPTGLSLIIEDGEVMGIYSKSEASRKVVTGYIAVMELFAVINYNDTVEIPTITKYQHDPRHDELQTAIDNMRSLTSYKVDFTQSVYTSMTVGAQQSGYEEIVTENECFFRPYTMGMDNGEQVHKFEEGGEYGFRKISATAYNSYAYNKEKEEYQAARAFSGDFSNAKASFAFASELFTMFYVDEELDETVFYVDEIMCQVATTWYKTPGTDMALYGLFATNYLITIEQFLPYVVVKDGYITEAAFFFNLSEMYGTVHLKFSDFNTAKLDDDHADKVTFQTREMPTNWSQMEITVTGESGTNDDTYENAATYLAKEYGSAEAVPFFGDALGDCFGFAMTTTYMPANSSRLYDAVAFYYDVPVDSDYTLNSSMNALRDLARSSGFTETADGEFKKGNLWIALSDSGLDLMVYVWKI